MPGNDTEDFGENEDLFAIFDDLFAPLAAKFGPLDDSVLSSPMMMFGISFMQREADGLYVTYEPYHLADTHSREGLKFALFMVSHEPQDMLTDLLTAVAEWALENEIGDGDTIDLSMFEVKDLPSGSGEILLFSQGPEGYGLYELRFKAA